MESWSEGIEVERHLGSTLYRLPRRSSITARISGLLALLASLALTAGLTLLVIQQVKSLKDPMTALLAISVMALIYFGLLGASFRWTSLLLLTRTEIELRPRYVRVTERFLWPVWRKTLLLQNSSGVSILRLFNAKQFEHYPLGEDRVQSSPVPQDSHHGYLSIGRDPMDWEAVTFAQGHTFGLLRQIALDMSQELGRWNEQSLDEKEGDYLKPPPDSLVTFRVEGETWSTLFPQGGWSQRNINLFVGGGFVLLLSLLYAAWVVLYLHQWSSLYALPLGLLVGGGSLFAGWIGVSTQARFEWNPQTGLFAKGRNLVRSYKLHYAPGDIVRISVEESPIRTSEEAALQVRIFRADESFEAFLDEREREEALWFAQTLSQTLDLPLEFEYEDEHEHSSHSPESDSSS